MADRALGVVSEEGHFGLAGAMRSVRLRTTDLRDSRFWSDASGLVPRAVTRILRNEPPSALIERRVANLHCIRMRHFECDVVTSEVCWEVGQTPAASVRSGVRAECARRAAPARSSAPWHTAMSLVGDRSWWASVMPRVPISDHDEDLTIVRAGRDTPRLSDGVALAVRRLSRRAMPV